MKTKTKQKKTWPCEQHCSKCGSLDIHLHYRVTGEKWDDKELKVSCFINRLSNWTVEATQDCIIYHCRRCQFDWQSKPICVTTRPKTKGRK